MTRRTSMISLAASGILFLLCLLVWAYALFARPDPAVSYMSLCDGANVAVTHRWGGRIVLFNNAEAGPYMGSMVRIGASDSDGRSVSGWGDNWGIYVRTIRTGSEQSRTVLLSIWYPLLITGLCTGVFLRHSWKTRRVRG